MQYDDPENDPPAREASDWAPPSGHDGDGSVAAMAARIGRPVGCPVPERSSNPWGLTRAEAHVMDAICEHGCHKAAARALHRSLKTIEAHAWRAGQKMGQPTGLSKYLVWDRWTRA